LPLIHASLLLAALILGACVGRTQGGTSLTASPNPVPADAASGTTISWTTGDGSSAQVYLSVDGGAESLFASGPAGSADAPWVSRGSTYEFRLYADTERAAPLARLTVAQGDQ
jgi:hypothetical protein